MKNLSFSKSFLVFLTIVLILALFPAIHTEAAPTKSQLDMQAAIAEQLKMREGAPRLHPDLQKISGNKTVGVIVHFTEKPVGLERGIRSLQGKAVTAAQTDTIEAQVGKQQAAAKTAMNQQGIAFTEGQSYSTVLNGIATTVKASDLPKLLKIKGVAFVEPDRQFRTLAAPSNSNTVTPSFVKSQAFLGVEKLWQEGLQGQGVKVAVLDTGIDPNHPEFKGIYKGGKNFVPFSPHYTVKRAPDDASETRPSERPPSLPKVDAFGFPFETFHGTHVAGTLAAIGANRFGFKGVAPKVDLYAYRVFGAYSTASMSWILAGMEEAVKQDMDIINLSFGAITTSEADAAAFAVNNAMLSGTVTVSAMGNAGQFRGSIGSPATSRLGISVGNSTIPEERHTATVNLKAGNITVAKTVNMIAAVTGTSPGKQFPNALELVAVPGAGNKTDYKNLAVKGKAVLVSVGSIEIIDKIKIAKEMGAAAILVHNIRNGFNAPGPSGTYLNDGFEFIPAFDLSQTDGEALRRQLLNGKGSAKFSNIKLTLTKGDEIDATSSSGPSTPNFDLKPDLVAPGTSIMSAIPMYKADNPKADYSKAYVRFTGTSMASPHVAGVAALILQAHPDWTPFDVKVALMNTAKLLDTNKYDVFAQGAGRVQAYDAVHPPFLAYSIDKAVLNATGALVDNKKGSVTFGMQPLSQGNISVTKKVIVKDILRKGGAYKVSVETKKSFGNAKVTVDKTAFTLKGEQVLNVKLTASKNAEAAEDSEILGYIHISNGSKRATLPFAASFSPTKTVEVQNLQVTETDLSFNGDGKNDSANITYRLTGGVGKNAIELWDLMNPGGGAFGDGYIGFVHASESMKAGVHKMPLLGLYRPWSGEPAKRIPDGMYQLHFMAEPADGASTYVFSLGSIIFVKSTPPKISGSVTAGRAIGKVADPYLAYNTELLKLGEPFDINSKLHASYILNGRGKSVPVELDQNGAFAFDVPGFREGVDTLTFIVVDEAANRGKALLK
ncbi:S8 family serine peptidase [Planococcus chinensis]|uniref:S8 family serine peptidase n=1 Tax=Planococcus chinensis TaxID=272917 RepID=A0ABW4QED3_9BACL